VVGKRLILALLAVTLTAIVSVPASAAKGGPRSGSGYWTLGYDGTVYPFGTARLCDSFGNGHLPVYPPDSYGADIVATPNGRGYWALDGENYVEFFDCGMSTDDAFSVDLPSDDYYLMVDNHAHDFTIDIN
jgi:hypothetical protein